MANIPQKTIKYPGLPDTYTFLQLDDTLSTAGKAADAKKTGDELTQLKSALESIGLTIVNGQLYIQPAESIA